MRNELLTPRQIFCLLTMFLFGSAAILGGRTDVAQDSWIAMLMGAAFALPVFLMYGRLNQLFPEMGFFDLVQMLLGKVAGKVVIALMTWYCLHLCATVLRNFTEFVAVCVMPETPHIPIMLMVILMVIYLARSGVETMGKWSAVMLPVLLTVVTIMILLSVNMLETTRILPIAEHGLGKIAASSYMFVAFPYLESVVFICAFQGAIEVRKPYKPMLTAFLVAVLFLTVIDVRNTMLLGAHTLDAVYFPSYIAVKVIRIGDIVSRTEGSLSMNYVIGGVAKISVCLIGATKGLKTLLGLRAYKPIVLPMGLLAAGLCTTLYENVTQQYDFLQTYQIYAIPFQIIIPVLIWVLAEFKAKKLKAQKGAQSQA